MVASAILAGNRITSREPVPEPLLGGAGVALGAAAQEGGCERIDPRSEQRQDRRQHDQRNRGGDQRDQRSADAHRVERCGKTSSEASAPATVSALNRTVRPAVAIVRRIASSPGPVLAISSR